MEETLLDNPNIIMYLVILILIIYTILRYVLSGSVINLFLLLLQSFSAAIILLEDLKKIEITQELYYSVIFISILFPAVILFHDAIFDERLHKKQKTDHEDNVRDLDINLNDIKTHHSPRELASFDKKVKTDLLTPYENAQKALYSQNWQAALNIYETLISINPKNPLLRYNHGCVLYSMLEYHKALEVFLKTNSLLKKTRNKDILSSSCYNTGCCLFQLNKYTQAMLYFKKVLKYGGHDLKTSENMVMLQLLGPDFGEAKNLYRSLVHKVSMPFLFKICYITGTIHEKNKEYDKTLLSYSEAKKIKREQFLMHKTAALLYNIDRTEEAIKEYEELIDLFPEDIKAYIGLGIAYYRKGDIVNSKKHLEKTLGIRKGRYNYAFVLYKNGEFHEAAGVIAPSLKDEPSVDELKLAGSIYINLGNYYEAIKYYREALISQPENHSILHDLGRAYALVKDYHMSKEYFRSALALKEDDPDIVEGLIRLYIGGNDMKNALKLITIYENLLKESKTGRAFLEYLNKEVTLDAEHNT